VSIFRFPNLDTLQLALTARIVPDAVSLAPAAAHVDPAGPVWVQPSAAVPVPSQAELKRMGVEVIKRSPRSLDVSVGCWPQLLPIRRTGPVVPPTDRTPVVFELDESQLPELVGEILRLGNDRQGFRWLQHDGRLRPRALLRVVGPPYYALLRAVDREAPTGPVAYIEQAPRVLVELGYTHPLAGKLQVPPGKLLLLRPPRVWTFLDEAPFRDLYEILDFALPQPEIHWRPVEPARRIAVPLRLARGGEEPAELWVLGDRGEEQVEALVRDADERLVQRLAFAVALEGEGDRATVLLRARPSKLPLPVLVLDGVGYRPYLKLPNLFLPCGTRLHPPLRRDAVARLLASDPASVTWLRSGPDGSFQPERLPEDAFRPLSQWVDYVLDREHRALEAWVQAARFDFEPFVCRDDQPAPAPAPPPEPKAPRELSHPRGPRGPKGPAAAPRSESHAEPANLEETTDLASAARRTKRREESAAFQVEDRPDELQKRLFALEDRFLALESPLDSEERQEIWRELAELNTALERPGETTVCWAHALWEQAAVPEEVYRAWFVAESARSARRVAAAPDLDHLLHQASPTTSDLRTLATYLTWSAAGDRPVPGLAPRLGPIQHFLEQHEGLLPVRLAWLAWSAIVRLSEGDVLALARARDRVLERLFHHGLSAELDMPGFLRFSKGAASERVRKVRDSLFRYHRLARFWAGEGIMVSPGTRPLADLMFAYGLARIGDPAGCHNLVQEAGEKLKGSDAVSTWLFEAFHDRIKQALEGRPGVGTLPEALLQRLEHMDTLVRYKVDRLRRNSRILEPHEEIDPYRHYSRKFHTPLDRELAELFDVQDRPALAQHLTRLLHAPRKGARAGHEGASILATALELAPRLGEAFARDLLDRVAPVVNTLADLQDQARLLEKGLSLAAHYDQAEQVQAFVTRFHALLDGQQGDEAIHALEPLLGECFRGLRKLGMRDEIRLLLDRMAALVLRSRSGEAAAAATSLLELTVVRRGPQAISWARTLRLLLHIAAGWYDFGQDDQARHILDQARSLLFEGDLPPVEQTRLACGTIAALGHAPLEAALLGLEEIFHRLERVHDSYTTNSHYSASRLDVIEAVVLALVSDDLLFDRSGRRWLDDDEYLVRRRIHRDVRAALALGQEHRLA
jgi:hypothetical protein